MFSFTANAMHCIAGVGGVLYDSFLLCYLRATLLISASASGCGFDKILDNERGAGDVDIDI
jgi:hypothetical protein